MKGLLTGSVQLCIRLATSANNWCILKNKIFLSNVENNEWCDTFYWQADRYNNVIGLNSKMLRIWLNVMNCTPLRCFFFNSWARLHKWQIEINYLQKSINNYGLWCTSICVRPFNWVRNLSFKCYSSWHGNWVQRSWNINPQGGQFT